MNSVASFRNDYDGLVRRLPAIVDEARLTVGGFSTCVDVYLSLREVLERFGGRTNIPAKAKALIEELRRRAGGGVGGELFVDWPDGPRWVDAHLAGQRAIGGTNAQAAYMLSLLDAPALIALEDRSEDQLGVLHPQTLVASEDGLAAVTSIDASGQGRVPHYIFEFTAGDALDGVPIPRSSRIIVRFGHDPLQRDAAFVALSTARAREVGAGVICGFNEIEPGRAVEELDYAAAVARGWRDAGMAIVHLELGAFHDNQLRDLTIDRLLPRVTSLGMSLSELEDLVGHDGAPEERAARLAASHGLARVCVHADAWAFSVTSGDHAREREALEVGCLLASARASKGYFVKPERVPDGAQFMPSPIREGPVTGGRTVVTCSTPYLEKPAATIGLGDTFLAGTVLVLGGAGKSATSGLGHQTTAAGSR